MADVRVTMKDGTVREFKHEGRAGGSYTKHAAAEGAFLVIEDVWGKKTMIPAADIADVVIDPGRYY